jgi:hypothetical protein
MKTNKLFWITALIAVIGFSMIGCQVIDKPPQTVSGKLTASSSGEIIFEYIALLDGVSQSCLITTNLPVPDNNFSLNTGNEKRISELQASQIVQYTATVEKGALYKDVDGNKAIFSSTLLD